MSKNEPTRRYTYKKEDTAKESIRKTKNKIGKENLSAKELAIILNVDDKTIKNHILRLCTPKNNLSEKDFKINGKYIVKPEVQHLFCLLVKVNIGANHKTSPGYSKRTTTELINGIEKELDIADKERIQSSEPYLTARVESTLIEHYFLAWHMLNKSIFEMDTTLRIRYIEKVIKTISYLRKLIGLNKEKVKGSENKIKKIMPAYLVDENINALLENALISIMAAKLNSAEIASTKNTDMEKLLMCFVTGFIMFPMEAYIHQMANTTGQ